MAPSKRWLVVLLALACALSPVTLRAETPIEQLARAKALFREGNALLEAGDPERALERFLQSRELVPSGKNTANAAICLERLGRDDEALEMYEELLSRFARDLDQQDRENLSPIMASLRRGLASLELSANVEGLVTVDGKPRGRLPRVTALRVRPGKRRVRVVREGYQSFDRLVDAVAGQTLSVDAELEPLAGTGAVRVEVSRGATGQVWINGKPRGDTPWEGTLKPGVHELQVVSGDVGSMPEKLEVLEGKTLLVRVSMAKLGSMLRVFAEPTTARLSLASLEVGRGQWSGRLPVGSYRLRVEEPGYFASDTQLVVREGDGGQALRIDLQRDPAHPRWPQTLPVRWGAGLETGLAYAPTPNGGAERQCPGLCAGSTAALGGKLELLLEAVHERGFGVELAVGYLAARQSFSRAAFGRYAGETLTYALEHELVMGGVYGRAAAIAALPLDKAFTLRTALGVGVMNAAYEARSEGVGWTTGEPTSVSGLGLDPISKVELVVTSSVALERQLGPVHVSLGLAAWFFPASGPNFSEALLTAQPGTCDPAMLGVFMGDLGHLLAP